MKRTWDVFEILIILSIAAVLGWSLFVILLSPLMGQTSPRALVVWDRLVLSGEPRQADQYSVKRASSATATAVEVGRVPQQLNPAFQDDSIEPTTRYWFSVSAIDSAGEGAAGAAQNNPFRFSDIQPASPANVICTQTKVANKVTLNCSWGVVTKTRSLIVLPTRSNVVYNGFLSNTGTLQNFQVLQGTSIQIGNMKRHQTFYFYVTAVWNGIESLGSPAVRIQT